MGTYRRRSSWPIRRAVVLAGILVLFTGGSVWDARKGGLAQAFCEIRGYQ